MSRETVTRPQAWSTVYRDRALAPTDWEVDTASSVLLAWMNTHTGGYASVSVGARVLTESLHLPNPGLFEGGDFALGGTDVLTALSVLDHLAQPKAFLRKAVRVLAPGGLLFLTAAFWDCEGPDLAWGHERRARIYHEGSWNGVRKYLNEEGLRLFGSADWVYPGPQIGGDHTLVSLAMVKPR